MESWKNWFSEIFYNPNFWMQVIAIIAAAALLAFLGYLFRIFFKYLFYQCSESAAAKNQSISMKDSPNATAIQAGGGVNLQQDGILNKIALNKGNPVETLKVVKDIGRILDDDPSYKKTISTDAEKTCLSFSPRDKKAQSLKGEGRFVCEFPKDTKEGLEAWKELKESLETGKPVKVEGKYIKDFQIRIGETDLIPQNMRTPNSLQTSYLKIESVEDTRPIPATLLLRGTRDEEKLEGVLFYIEKAGSRQITISNEKQGYPLKLQIVIDRNRVGSINFKLTIDEAKTALQAYRIIKFLTSLKRAKYFEIDFPEIDSSLKTEYFPPKALDKFGIYEKYLPLLEKLNFISDSLGQTFPNPFGRTVNKDDIQNIENAYSIIKTGQIRCTVGNLGLIFKKEKAEEFIKKCEEEGSITPRIEHKAFVVNILGTPVDLGSYNMEIKLTVKDLAQMRLDLTSQREDSIETVLLKEQKQETLARFKQWESK